MTDIALNIISSQFESIQDASLDNYQARGGYRALLDLMDSKSHPYEIYEELANSGLRGRGGAGFPTAEKWKNILDNPNRSEQNPLVVCNADEGDPGAFMDRLLLEKDPHSVIEGIEISSFCLDASEAYIFLRSEYKNTYSILANALSQARDAGLLPVDIHLVRSGGNYLLGEETAMISVLENGVAAARKKPPYPSEKGLWGRPTLINNVETFSNVSLIAREGADSFRLHGNQANPGTKIFCITGCHEKTGYIEVPLGCKLSDLLSNFLPQGYEENYKAIQIGGPSGAFFPIDLDVSLDYDSLSSLDGTIGSGGIVLISKSDCIIETLRYYLSFSQKYSCGKCHACKNGLARCIELLEKFTTGCAQREDLDELRSLSVAIPKKTSCGLGKTSTRCLRTALTYFEDEFREHMQKKCPSLVCKDLIKFDVLPNMCPGCRACLFSCPTNAMKGRFGKPFHIEQRLCEKCWMCITSCPYNAIQALPKHAEYLTD